MKVNAVTGSLREETEPYIETKAIGMSAGNILSIACHRKSMVYYTPIYLVESVENGGLCVRRCLACSSYANVMYRVTAACNANVMYRGLAITRLIKMPAPGIKLCAIAGYRLFHFFFTGFNFYWLDEVNRSISVVFCINIAPHASGPSLILDGAYIVGDRWKIWRIGFWLGWAIDQIAFVKENIHTCTIM